jgi:two-component system cell cycle sensor histidine kinase/response regulator CckA
VTRVNDSSGELRILDHSLIQLLGAFPGVVWLTDRDLRYELLLGADLAALGIEADDIVGRTVPEFLGGNGAAQPAIDAHHHALGGEPAEYEQTYLGQIRRGRIEPVVDANGAVTGLVGMSTNVTGQRAIDRSLAELGAIVTSTNDAIIGKSLEGAVTSWNAAAERIYGYTADEIVGAPIALLIPDDRADELPSILQRVQRGEAVPPYTTVRVRKDGTRIDVSLSVSPIKDPSGVVVGASTIARDITEQTKLEAQLRQSQKLEAIGSLAGGIAHDFNNILLVIRGHSAVLLRDLEHERLRESVQEIDRAAERAADFTHQLLAFSRQQVLHPEVANVNTLVEETLRLVTRMLDEDIVVDVQLEPELNPILIDGVQLTQAILNLVVNARDAMPDGGTLTIRTANVDLDEAYAATHEEVTAGPYVLLQVTDSGTGVEPIDQSRIFDPFFTTKAHGTGLGLAGVFGLVKQSSGHIWLYSEPGMGTTFKLYFPITSERKAVAPEPERERSLDGTETVLLVEDTDMVRTLVASTLELYGYTVLAAAGAAEALEIAGNQPGGIDLLMTDVVMPGMNGRELAEQLVAKYPNVKVLFTSGYPADTIIRHGISESRTAFLEKPYLPVDLAKKIREVID